MFHKKTQRSFIAIEKYNWQPKFTIILEEAKFIPIRFSQILGLQIVFFQIKFGKEYLLGCIIIHFWASIKKRRKDFTPTTYIYRYIYWTHSIVVDVTHSKLNKYYIFVIQTIKMILTYSFVHSQVYNQWIYWQEMKFNWLYFKRWGYIDKKELKYYTSECF